MVVIGDQYDYIYRYMKQNMKTICVRFHLEKDADIVERLSKEKNMSGYIKKLIRDDIDREKERAFAEHLRDRGY